MLPVTVSSLSLRDLEYAVAVARERHFGRAAEYCGVSQAALSEQVRKLESVLGVPLFERTTRKVEPTVRGEAILRQAEALLGDARRMLEDARRSAEPLSGELRLGVIATLGPYYMPSVIALGRQRFPRLGLRLLEATTEELLVALRHGKLDAILWPYRFRWKASLPSRCSSNRSGSHVRATTNSRSVNTCACVTSSAVRSC